ncbi:hypothetical protein ACQ5SK_09790 [Bradyrhizobium japonicum]
MAFWRRLFGLGPNTNLAPGRGWIVPVVGESNYQDVLESLYRMNGKVSHDIKVTASLVPEDGNAFDFERGAGRDRFMLCWLSPARHGFGIPDRPGEFAGKCSAKIVGGFELEDGTSAFFGVKLNLAWPPRIK